MNKSTKINQRKRRTRVRLGRLAEKSGRLRLSVFRSNTGTYAQIIDDSKGVTVCSATDKDLAKDALGKTKTEKAFLVGEAIAKKAKAKKITKIYFDRGSYKYHGRVKAVAEGARAGGLNI